MGRSVGGEVSCCCTKVGTKGKEARDNTQHNTRHETTTPAFEPHLGLELARLAVCDLFLQELCVLLLLGLFSLLPRVGAAFTGTEHKGATGPGRASAVVCATRGGPLSGCWSSSRVIPTVRVRRSVVVVPE